MRRDDVRWIGKMMAKLKQRLAGLVTRSTVRASSVTGRGQVLTVSLLQGQTRDAAEMFEPYGLAGAVPVGAEGLAVSVGGSSDQTIMICASPKGGTPDGRAAGEVDLYSQHGQFIRLHTDGSISLQPSSTGFVYTGGEPNPAMPFVNRHGDNCVQNAQMATWMTQVTTALSDPGLVAILTTATPPTPVAGPIATTVATATKTKVT